MTPSTQLSDQSIHIWKAKELIDWVIEQGVKTEGEYFKVIFSPARFSDIKKDCKDLQWSEVYIKWNDSKEKRISKLNRLLDNVRRYDPNDPFALEVSTYDSKEVEKEISISNPFLVETPSLPSSPTSPRHFREQIQFRIKDISEQGAQGPLQQIATVARRFLPFS